MLAPEYIREGKVFPFPYSLYHALLTERIDFDSPAEQQQHSFSYGERIVLTGRPGTQHWTITPPDDYFYHLEGLRIFYPEDTVTANVLEVEVEQPERGRVPVRANAVPILTTPGDQIRRLYMVRINTLYGPSMNIHIKISGQDGTNPAYVDLMSEGLYIPAVGLKPV